MGAKDYFKESWNIVDVATIALSLVTIILWLIKVIFFNIGSNIVQRGGAKRLPLGKILCTRLIERRISKAFGFETMEVILCLTITYSIHVDKYSKGFSNYKLMDCNCFWSLFSFIIQMLHQCINQSAQTIKPVIYRLSHIPSPIGQGIWDAKYLHYIVYISLSIHLSIHLK